MALVLGELVEKITVDDRGMEQGLDRAEGRFGTFGDHLSTVGAAAGAAAAAALGVAVASTLDFDRAQAKFAAQLGSREFAEDLGGVAGRLYAQGFGAGVGDSMAAIRAVISAGLVMEDAAPELIENVTGKAQALAEVFDLDVRQAARSAGQMIRTGMARDAAEAFDIMTRGFQQTGDLADDLLDTFSEYSTQFRKLGLDGGQATGLLTQGLKAGARDLDIVGDALKEFSIRAVDGSTTTADGFRMIGLSAQRMAIEIGAGSGRATAALDLTLDRLRAIKDPVKQAQAAVALFGTQAEDLGAALFALDPTSAVATLGQVGGAADQLSATLHDSAANKLETFKRQAQAALVEQPARAIPLLESMGRFLKQNKDLVTGVAIGLGVFAAAVGVVKVAMLAYNGAILIGQAATATWTAIQWALNVAMMANPIGLIILAVVGLIAIFAGLWIQFEGFRNFWKATWDVIWGAMRWVWDWISTHWQLLLGILTGPIGLAVLAITSHWDQIKAGASGAWQWIVDRWNGLVGFVTGLPGRLTAAAHGMWDGIRDSFKAAINWIIRGWNGLSLRIPSVDTGIPGVGRVGGMTLSTPDIPYLASGGDVTRAGWAMVGERGPERLLLPAGAQVRPLDRGAGRSPDGVRIDGSIEVKATCPGCGVTHLREVISTRGGNVQAVLGEGPG